MSDSQLPVPIEQPGPLALATAPMSSDERWQLIRAMFVFQIKLVVDGLKDIVLGPLSLVAGAFDLARGTPTSKSWFRAVLRSGARFDAWVNLFEEEPAAQALAVPSSTLGGPPSPPPKLDAHLRRLEALIVEQHARGGITQGAKQAIDRALDMIEGQSSKLEASKPSDQDPASGPNS